MDIEELRECCLSVKGAGESFPFSAFPGAADILVFKVAGKMFAYIDLFPSDGVFRVFLKCAPERIPELRNTYRGIVPSSRKQARNWNGVDLDSDVPAPLIRELVLHSVNEVLKTLSRKARQEYETGDTPP